MPLVFAFVATPLLVRGLGIEQYGYYSLVLAVIGVGFTGVGKVSAKYIPEYRALGETDELENILFAILLLTTGFAVLQGIILALATPFVVERALKVPTYAQSELQTAIYVACLIGPVTIISQMFQSAAQGLQLFRGVSLITITIALALNIGSITIAVEGYRYTYILIWNLFVVVAALAAYFVFVKKYLPELKFRGRTNSEVVRKVGRFAVSIFIYQTITSILYIFERAFVLRNFGSEALTYYTVPLMFGLYLHAFIVSFSQAMAPKLNQMLDRRDELLDFYKFSTKIVLAVTVLIASGYFVLGHEFLTLWLGEDFGVRSYSLLFLHGVAFSMIAVSINCWMLAEASHRPGMNAVSSSVTCIVGILVIVMLSSSFGLDGVALGRLVGAVAVLPLIPYLEARLFGSPLISFWLVNLCKLVAAAMAAIVVSTVTSKVINHHSWGGMIMFVTILTVIYLAILILLRYFSRVELKQTRTEVAG